jgi:hypothetical protein
MTTNGRVGGRKRTKAKDPLDSLIDLGEDVLESYKAAIEQAIEKSMAIREAEAKFGAAGAAGIQVRREGLLQRENPEDRKRADALKANRDRGYLTADHLKILGGFAAKGQEFVLDMVEHLTEDTHNRSPEVQPIAEMLTKASTKVISKAYVESLQFLGERAFTQLTRRHRPSSITNNIGTLGAARQVRLGWLPRLLSQCEALEDGLYAT